MLRKDKMILSLKFYFRLVYTVLTDQVVLPTFCLCFVFTGLNFWGMLHHVCGVSYDENLCGPIRTCKCRSTNWLINYMFNEYSILINYDPWGEDVNSWRCSLLVHVKLLRCHEQPLVSMPELFIGRTKMTPKIKVI